jgi:hypothetical protein
MARLSALAASERTKIRFIHLNHTNSALTDGSDARRRIVAGGFGVASELETTEL